MSEFPHSPHSAAGSPLGPIERAGPWDHCALGRRYVGNLKLTGQRVLVDRFDPDLLRPGVTLEAVLQQIERRTRPSVPGVAEIQAAALMGNSLVVVRDPIPAPPADPRLADRDLKEALADAARVARAVAALHEAGRVHGNICPALVALGEGTVLREAALDALAEEFGLAATEARWAPGKAPELWTRTPGSADARSDVYGLAVTLGYLLLGAELLGSMADFVVFGWAEWAREPGSQLEGLDRLSQRVERDDLAEVWGRALAKDPEERDVTAADLAAALERASGRGASAGAGGSGATASPPRPQSATAEEALDPEDLSGQLVGGYSVGLRIGRGGMGTVYRAKQVNLDRQIALKVLATDLVARRDLVERFHREARAIAKLSHRNIAVVHDVGAVGRIHYIAMELVEGLGLDRVIADRLFGGAGFTEAELAVLAPFRGDWVRTCIEAIAAIADALHHAHQAGIVHRDVKPQNVLVGRDGIPKLVDFGLAREDQSDALASSHVFVGTYAYSAPEQIVAKESVDRRSDVYSLGVALYECLTLQRPFEGDGQKVFQKLQVDAPPPMRAKNPALPEELDRIVLRAVAREKNDRYATAAGFAVALRDFLEETPQEILGAAAPVGGDPEALDAPPARSSVATDSTSRPRSSTTSIVLEGPSPWSGVFASRVLALRGRVEGCPEEGRDLQVLSGEGRPALAAIHDDFTFDLALEVPEGSHALTFAVVDEIGRQITRAHVLDAQGRRLTGSDGTVPLRIERSTVRPPAPRSLATPPPVAAPLPMAPPPPAASPPPMAPTARSTPAPPTRVPAATLEPEIDARRRRPKAKLLVALGSSALAIGVLALWIPTLFEPSPSERIAALEAANAAGDAARGALALAEARASVGERASPVLRLRLAFAEGDHLEAGGDVPGAVRAFRRALELSDPGTDSARDAWNRIQTAALDSIGESTSAFDRTIALDLLAEVDGSPQAERVSFADRARTASRRAEILVPSDPEAAIRLWERSLETSGSDWTGRAEALDALARTILARTESVVAGDAAEGALGRLESLLARDRRTGGPTLASARRGQILVRIAEIRAREASPNALPDVWHDVIASSDAPRADRERAAKEVAHALTLEPRSAVPPDRAGPTRASLDRLLTFLEGPSAALSLDAPSRAALLEWKGDDEAASARRVEARNVYDAALAIGRGDWSGTERVRAKRDQVEFALSLEESGSGSLSLESLLRLDRDKDMTVQPVEYRARLSIQIGRAYRERGEAANAAQAFRAAFRLGDPGSPERRALLPELLDAVLAAHRSPSDRAGRTVALVALSDVAAQIAETGEASVTQSQRADLHAALARARSDEPVAALADVAEALRIGGAAWKGRLEALAWEATLRVRILRASPPTAATAAQLVDAIGPMLEEIAAVPPTLLAREEHAQLLDFHARSLAALGRHGEALTALEDAFGRIPEGAAQRAEIVERLRETATRSGEPALTARVRAFLGESAPEPTPAERADSMLIAAQTEIDAGHGEAAAAKLREALDRAPADWPRWPEAWTKLVGLELARLGTTAPDAETAGRLDALLAAERGPRAGALPADARVRLHAARARAAGADPAGAARSAAEALRLAIEAKSPDSEVRSSWSTLAAVWSANLAIHRRAGTLASASAELDALLLPVPASAFVARERARLRTDLADEILASLHERARAAPAPTPLDAKGIEACAGQYRRAVEEARAYGPEAAGEAALQMLRAESAKRIAGRPVLSVTGAGFSIPLPSTGWADVSAPPWAFPGGVLAKRLGEFDGEPIRHEIRATGQLVGPELTMEGLAKDIEPIMEKTSDLMDVRVTKAPELHAFLGRPTLRVEFTATLQNAIRHNPRQRGHLLATLDAGRLLLAYSVCDDVDSSRQEHAQMLEAFAWARLDPALSELPTVQAGMLAVPRLGIRMAVPPGFEERTLPWSKPGGSIGVGLVKKRGTERRRVETSVQIEERPLGILETIRREEEAALRAERSDGSFLRFAAEEQDPSILVVQRHADPTAPWTIVVAKRLSEQRIAVIRVFVDDVDSKEVDSLRQAARAAFGPPPPR